MIIIEPDAENNLSKTSALDLFQVRSVSEERLIYKIGRINEESLLKAHSAIKTVFGIK